MTLGQYSEGLAVNSAKLPGLLKVAAAAAAAGLKYIPVFIFKLNLGKTLRLVTGLLKMSLILCGVARPVAND